MTKHLALIALLSFGAAACGSTTVTVNNASNSNTTVSNAPAATPASTVSSNTSTSSNTTANTSTAPTETVDKEGNKKIIVHFAPGKSEGTYSNTFAGYKYVDYEFKASKGQTLTTKIVKSDGDDAILGVMRNDLMVAPGSTQVQDWSGELPEDGTYTIRVGQMRAEARRSETPKKFTLDIKIN